MSPAPRMEISAHAGRRIRALAQRFAARFTAGLVAAMLTAGGPAAAASFTATTTPFAGAHNCSGVTGAGNSPIPLVALASCGLPGITTTAAASAAYGTVGAMASALGGSSASGLGSFSDTVRFTSTDPSAVFTTVALQLELTGFLSASAGPFDPTNNPAPNATSSILAEAFFNGGQFIFERTQVNDRNGSREGSFQNMFTGGSGDPHAGALDVILVTPSFVVPLNRDISFAFLIQVGAQVFGTGSGASSDFAHTLGLPTGRDVFLLSDGVTANAGDYLVDNRFGAVAAGVPEPAGWALLIGGFGFAGVALRRARGTRCSEA